MQKNTLTGLVALLLAGCATVQPTGQRVPVEFRLGSSEAAAGLWPQTVRGSESTVYLSDQAVLGNEHIVSADAKETKVGPHVQIVFTAEGRNLFAKVTRENLGKPLGILVDGELIYAPVILEEISSGEAWIYGLSTIEEAERIANGIMGE